jgi:hypothetical protein
VLVFRGYADLDLCKSYETSVSIAKGKPDLAHALDAILLVLRHFEMLGAPARSVSCCNRMAGQRADAHANAPVPVVAFKRFRACAAHAQFHHLFLTHHLQRRANTAGVYELGQQESLKISEAVES